MNYNGNTNHEIKLHTLFIHYFLHDQAVKDGRAQEETTHPKGTKPYSCLTYFHNMFSKLAML